MPSPTLIYPTLLGETYPVVKRATFSTITQPASSGLEVRIGNYSYPLWEWEIPYSWLSQEAAILDYQSLVGLYLKSYGQFGALLYTDVNDFTTSPGATPTPSVIGVGTGAQVAFQIGRTLGGFFEPIFDINNVPNAPKIYLNGVLTAAYTINSTGLITFSGAPGNGVVITADFFYYWRARFAEDILDASNFVKDWWEIKKVKLRQVRAQ